MAATGLQLNISAVSFNSVTYTKITGAQSDHGGNLISFMGDIQIYPIVVAVSQINPTFSITLGDIGAAETLVTGVSGPLTITFADALHATGGAVVFTVANAVVQSPQSSAQHGAFGSATVSWMAVSSDGLTNPVVISRT